jgi:hypothetical protein
VYKDEICAAVWIQADDVRDITHLLDRLFGTWKTVSQPEQVKKYLSPNGQLIGGLDNVFSTFTIFKGWGKPIWLTEFRRTGGVIAERTPEQIELAKATAELEQKNTELRKAKAAANDTLKEALSKWLRFEPVGTSADTKARIEKAVKMYLTDPDKCSLKKIADQFRVSRTTVSKWFAKFTKETGYPVVTFERHESVAAQSDTYSEPDIEE